MELSRDINTAFKQHVHNNYPDHDHEYRRIDLSVNVLSVAYWPTYTVMDVTIPGERVCYASFFNSKKFAILPQKT